VALGNLSGAYGNAVTLNNAANQLSGSFTGNGANVTNVSASSLGGLASSNFWQVGGNSVTSSQFLGTLNTQPLDFRANGLRALRLELTGNGAPNVIGGSPENSVGAGVTGAFIGGGGATNSIYTSTFSSTNRIASDLAVICGGTANLIGPGAPLSTIAGGLENTISNTSESTIGGGALNLISGGSQSTIAGGVRNTLILQADGFVGGVVNQLGGSDSRNLFFPRQTNWDNAISGGAANLITLGANDCFIGGGYFNTISNAGYGTIVGGLSNVVAGDYAFAAAAAPRRCMTARSSGRIHKTRTFRPPDQINSLFVRLAVWASAPVRPPANCMSFRPPAIANSASRAETRATTAGRCKVAATERPEYRCIPFKSLTGRLASREC
jgi:hypothetical protein